MAVSDHLRAASAELMKAADLVKIEIDNLRKQEVQSKQDLENNIAQLGIQMQQNNHEMNRADDPNRTSQLQTVITRLAKEIADKRSEIRQMQRDIDNAIADKQRLVDSLESQARSVSA